MTNLDSILKSRDITLPTKVRLVKAMVFPVVMHGCESWTIKKAECRRIDAFELWCWRRLLRVPWTARRSNQSILKEISPRCSLEGLMLTYFRTLSAAPFRSFSTTSSIAAFTILISSKVPFRAGSVSGLYDSGGESSATPKYKFLSDTKLKHDKRTYMPFTLSGFFSFSRFFCGKMRFFFALSDSFVCYLLVVVHPNFKIKFLTKGSSFG